MQLKDKPLLKKLIKYLEKTNEEDWCMNIVRSKDSKQNCVFGHVFNFGNELFNNYKPPVIQNNFAISDYYGNKMWEWFEESIGTTFYVYEINDGRHPKYNQPTSKKRILAYLNNILNGTELTTYEAMERAFNNSKSIN